jgi:transketolase
VITVEGHYNIGGLGSLVAEVIAETAAGSRLVRHGVEDMPVGITGSQEALERRYGLDGASLAQTALGLVSVATEAN